MKLFNIYWWQNILDYPFSLYRECKFFIQRGKRGYSDRDCWDIDFYLAQTITEMLKDLKENQNGIPLWKKDESEEKAQKRWDNILESMIFTFICAEKIADSDILYTTEDKRKEYEELSKATTIDLMTKEECEEYRKGWKYFSKHFHCLWN